MVKITGGREFGSRLSAMRGPQAKAKIGRALLAAGEGVQVEAQLSLTRGAVSGQGHMPSLPGQPPNQDTGVLGGNIETVMLSPERVEVSSNAPYAAALEYGTSKMAERPYMRPAVRNTEEERQQLWGRLAVSLARGGNGV